MPHQRKSYALVSCSLFVAVLSASVSGLRCPTTPTPLKNKMDSSIPYHNARRVSRQVGEGEKMGARTEDSKRKWSPLCCSITCDVINVSTVSSCHAVKYNSGYRDPHRCSQLEGRQNNQYIGHPVIWSHTCVIVWKRPPARLCSCGREILAMKRVPAAYTKSTPTTTIVAAGNPKAQYVMWVSINANKREAAAVQRVPIADFD